jgi:hypothetical protein
MRWLESCRGKNGPIDHMLRYAWDDWAKRIRDRKDAKESPRDQYKDFPDCHRYAAISELKFDQLKYGAQVIETLAPGCRGYGSPRQAPRKEHYNGARYVIT